MKVLKFGGSSVANATNISRVLDITFEAAASDRVVLVCSAISGCTDALISRQGFDEVRSRHEAIIDRLFTGEERLQSREIFGEQFRRMLEAPDGQRETFGEIFSTLIIAQKMRCEGWNAEWLDSRALVRLEGGKLDEELTYRNIREEVSYSPEARIFVAPGFIASDERRIPCTLGRGGSDYSASIYAAALRADDLQIWTDVPGVMTTNPKDIPAARTIPRMSYEAAFRLADSGAKVLYAPSVHPARKAGISINIRDTFNPSHPGTVIGPVNDSAYVGIARKGGLITIVSGEASVRDDALLCLAQAGIPLSGTQASEGCFSVEVAESDALEALSALHHRFFQAEGVVELYMAGCGAVGSQLLQMIKGHDIELKGVAPHEDADGEVVRAAIASTAPKRTFVDCTDSETIYRHYVPLLEAGVNVVSSNRRSIAVPYSEFSRMKAAALRGGAQLRFDTTVGAALPMLASVRVSSSRGDVLQSVEAVVSCTLNYILTSDLGPQEALAKAREKGLTEKDPSQDFSGADALRKLLIIARSAGVPLDAEDVEVEAVDPARLSAGTNLRYVASLERTAGGFRARIGLRAIDPGDPISFLRGTDNAIVVRTSLHPSPTCIQGAGEGASIAAAGILNDILR